MESFNVQGLEQILRIILIFVLILASVNGVLETIKSVVYWINYFKNKKNG